MAEHHVKDQPPEHVLSFFTDAAGDQLFVHADAAGLDLLIHRLTRLRGHLDRGECEHEHLFTTAWSGAGDLTTRGVAEGEHVVQHVKIYAWTPEWASKHELRDSNPDATPTA